MVADSTKRDRNNTKDAVDCSYRLCTTYILTCIGEAQLPTCNTGIDKEETVITHCTPFVGITDLQAARVTIHTTNKPNVSLSTNYV